MSKKREVTVSSWTEDQLKCVKIIARDFFEEALRTTVESKENDPKKPWRKRFEDYWKEYVG